MDLYRQGDVLIYRVDGLPRRKLKPVARDSGRIVLAYGETTGHAHAIADRDAELLEAEGLHDRFLRVLAEGGVELRHEEHATITLPGPANYVIRTQREYAPDAIRNVMD
jgi:hypothetical protein